MLTAIVRGEAWIASSVRNPQLRKNLRRLNRSFCRANRTIDTLREPVLRLFTAIISRGDFLSSHHDLGRHLVPALVRVAAYADRWIRPVESWLPSGGDLWRDLLQHLFVRWTVPTYFESAWLTKGSLRHLERDWYCEIASGANWRTLEKVPASVTSRAVHVAMTAPGDLTVRGTLGSWLMFLRCSIGVGASIEPWIW